MGDLKEAYRKALWDVYARSVSLVCVIAFLVAVVMGGYDVVQWAFPSFTLNASLSEKYKSNEAYTKFETLKKDRSPEEITRERLADYDRLLMMERRNAQQNLVKVVLGLLVIAGMNIVLARTYRHPDSPR